MNPYLIVRQSGAIYFVYLGWGVSALLLKVYLMPDGGPINFSINCQHVQPVACI